ncbi:MAG TPA: histidine ammonia-lyase [Acidobacteriota bacterium]|nr:histidine ammonia-lyase [Acidobacteriota bacterium]
MARKRPSRSLRLDGASLTLDDLERVARAEKPPPVALTPRALREMARSEKIVRRACEKNRTVYGINTGFGRLADVRIGPKERRLLQRNLILSHAAGVGPPCTRAEVRGMMLLRLNTLAKGYSGVRTAVAERLVDFLNADVSPVVPRRGSVGASGDLAPMAHVALAMIGEGTVEMAGRRTTARRALAHLGLRPLVLEAKEGLALINGVQASTALLALSLSTTQRLIEAADMVAALNALATGARPESFDPRLSRVRSHPGQKTSAQRIAHYLKSTGCRAAAPERVQDPYCLRCSPQVHGVSRDVIAGVVETCEIEMNAATDNPLVFADDNEIIAGGNFHGAPIGHAADRLAIAVTDVAGIGERRLALLLDPAYNHATRFLVPPRSEGLHSGLMMWQVTAAALVSEMKTLAHPASVDSIPTSMGQEDHVSMSMWAADKLGQIVERWRIVLAIELVAAWRALAIGRRLPRRGPLAALVGRMRAIHPPPFEDAVLGEMVEEAARILELTGNPTGGQT